jgi:hypothetical protein
MWCQCLFSPPTHSTNTRLPNWEQIRIVWRTNINLIHTEKVLQDAMFLFVLIGVRIVLFITCLLKGNPVDKSLIQSQHQSVHFISATSRCFCRRRIWRCPFCPARLVADDRHYGVRPKQEFQPSSETEYSAAKKHQIFGFGRIFGTFTYFQPKVNDLLHTGRKLAKFGQQVYNFMSVFPDLIIITCRQTISSD